LWRTMRVRFVLWWKHGWAGVTGSEHDLMGGRAGVGEGYWYKTLRVGTRDGGYMIEFARALIANGLLVREIMFASLLTLTNLPPRHRDTYRKVIHYMDAH
jgi:hypothetical protein